MERDYFEDLGVDESVILKWIFMKWIGGMAWTDLAQERNRWRADENVVYKTLNFHKMRGISCLSEQLLAFQEGACFIVLVT
jgi:hypothetical protein